MDIFTPTNAQSETLLSVMHSVPWPSDDAAHPMSLLSRRPAALQVQTPLVTSPKLASLAGVGQVLIKDERARMGLGSFKALGAAYVIARDAEIGQAKGQTYVAASAGNHGLSVAFGAAAFGAKAVIYLAETVPEAFAARLATLGAEVVRHGAIYEESMQGALAAAKGNDWVLLSDSSWPGYMERPRVLMEGYLVLIQETVAQLDTPPSHIFLQAGVGGLAAACAIYARKVWGNAAKIIVVEPDAAPALYASVKAGAPQITSGPVSEMGRLDCKEPSLIALKGLARDADVFTLLSEAEGMAGSDACKAAGLATTPSGAAGVSALLAAKNHRADLNLDETARVLVILSEEAS